MYVVPHMYMYIRARTYAYTIHVASIHVSQSSDGCPELRVVCVLWVAVAEGHYGSRGGEEGGEGGGDVLPDNGQLLLLPPQGGLHGHSEVGEKDRGGEGEGGGEQRSEETRKSKHKKDSIVINNIL